jgi:hypothetical protein
MTRNQSGSLRGQQPPRGGPQDVLARRPLLYSGSKRTPMRTKPHGRKPHGRGR